MAIDPVDVASKMPLYAPPQPPQADAVTEKQNDPAERAREAEERKRQEEAPPPKEDYLGEKVDLHI